MSSTLEDGSSKALDLTVASSLKNSNDHVETSPVSLRCLLSFIFCPNPLHDRIDYDVHWRYCENSAPDAFASETSSFLQPKECFFSMHKGNSLKLQKPTTRFIIRPSTDFDARSTDRNVRLSLDLQQNFQSSIGLPVSQQFFQVSQRILSFPQETTPAFQKGIPVGRN